MRVSLKDSLLLLSMVLAQLAAHAAPAPQATAPQSDFSVTPETAKNTQTIAPATVTLNLGAKQQFTSAGATAWHTKYGTVSSTGLYTAPSVWPAVGQDYVTVTGTGGEASAAIHLNAPTPAITSAGINGVIPLGVFSFTILGTGLSPGSVVRLNGNPLSVTYYQGHLIAQGFSNTPGHATLQVSNLALKSNILTITVGAKTPLVTPAAARRFLEQAAFGPSPADALAVQNLGFAGWIKAQFAMPQVSSYTSITTSNGGLPEHFLTNAVSNPDQLRQRVAFALSQIFVTSLEKIGSNPMMISYQDMLLKDAFTNYRRIMEDVTLSPAMGYYLDMGNNAKADPTTGSLANENFARELMQLFTIGTNELNQDGSLKLDSSGLPIPTYTQFQVTEFARVYTGWTYAPKPGTTLHFWESPSNYGNMVAYPSEHDSGSKQLLNGYVAPAGTTPLVDLDNALDNIYKNPNCGPFVSKQLIQHLVKSNPSPAYIQRVAAVFQNDGHGIAGDMESVITAILLDPEARANDQGGDDQPTDGHLQEPALFVAGMVRAFGGQMTNANYYAWDLYNQGQDIFDPPSVFNYYAPTTGAPGTALTGGEFQIYSPDAAILRANMVANLFSQWSSPVQTYGPGTTVDLSGFLALGTNPTKLVQALDFTLTHGTMPSEMKSEIIAAVTAETGGNLRRVQTGCYLILTSAYYNVWH